MTTKPTPFPFAETALSAAAALFLILTSLAGVLAADWAYPNPDQRASLVPNDFANLLVGLPFLAGAAWLARRGRRWARFCWPGALLYIIYNSLSALINLFPGIISLAHMVQLSLCAAILWFMAGRLDRQAVHGLVTGSKWDSAAGAALVGMGVLFFVRAAALIANPPDGSYFSSVEFAVTLADLLFSPLWVLSGTALLKRKVCGYIGTAACLSQLIALFAGLMLVMVIQPLLGGAPFAALDFLVVAIMSLVVLVPGLRLIGGLENKLPVGLIR